MTTNTRKHIGTGRTSFLNGRNRIGARRRCGGFKLVEFLVVLAVASTLGISAVSASYGSAEDRLQGPRINAQAALSQLAELQEAHFLFNKRYTQHLGANGLDVTSTTTPGGHYALRVELPADACPEGYCYILSAVPQGAQADDACGTLSLTSDGTKLPAGCW
jgi:type IV pilus assembly protein PilE